MNSEEGFDQHYDVILTGTDLISSLLSAAFARNGKKILHLDSNKYYGKEWRSMKLTDLFLWRLKRSGEESSIVSDYLIDSNEEQFLSCIRSNLFSNIEINFHVFENRLWYQKLFSHLLKNKCTENFLDHFYEECFMKLKNIETYEEGLLLIEKFKEQYSELNRIDNMFIFDLCPRLICSNEQIVKIMIASTVARYIEFKKISRFLTPMNLQNQESDEQLEIVEVPCTRSDIFMSDIISPVEKRYLMSFLEKCYHLERNNEWYRDDSQKPFEEFLKSHPLNIKLQKLIINTLLMTSESMSTLEALNKINVFLRSFGRFCDRPFLFPLFGSEDVIQAFCRYGAVWGGVYCLGVSMRGLIVDKKSNQCTSVLFNKSRIQCDHLITDYRIPELKPKINQKSISRAIILNTKSIKTINPENESGDLSFIHLPPEFTNGPSVYCFESDYSSRVCPKDFFIQYFWCESVQQTAKLDLEPVVEKLVSLDRESQSSVLPNELRMNILLSIYYNYKMEMVNYNENTEKLPNNIKIVSTPVNELNYEKATKEAELIFHQIYPGEEFFPRNEPNQNYKSEDESNINDPLDEIEI